MGFYLLNIAVFPLIPPVFLTYLFVCDFFELLSKDGAKIIIMSPKELISLLKEQKKVSQVIGYEDPLPDYDFYIPMLSIPKVLEWKPDTYPQNFPYLQFKGKDLDFISKNKINIAIPDNVYGAEIVFFHSNQSLSNLVINNLNAGAFNYFLSDSIHNSISFIVADKNGLDSTLSFSVPQNFPEGFMSNVKYKFIDANTAEVGSGAGKLNLTILPHKFDIYQNYPNPFNAETIVRYDLPKSEDVSIKIYDIMGREIFSEFYKKQSPGENSFIWKGNSNMDVLVSSGMYFLQMSAGKEVKRMKMILLK